MLSIEGAELTDEDIGLISSPEVGGLVLFSRNYSNREQLMRLVSRVRALRADLIIAVDQEGGRVQRFREEFELLPSLQKIGDLARALPDQSDDICFSLAWLMASDILSIGIDISFAPVLDLDRNSCSVISDRSFSEDPEEAVRMCRAYIAGMREAGMASTAKHFPGHGSVRQDSHLELPVDDRSMPEVKSRDLIPFIELSSEYDAVMPGHLKYPDINVQPVGFSPYWLQDILRLEIGFDGVIFSDDLTMEGAAESGSYSERARLALDAGCDMLLVCNNREGVIEVLEFLENRTRNANARHARLKNISSKRMKAMRARKVVSREAFLGSDIYTRAQGYLKRIVNTPEEQN